MDDYKIIHDPVHGSIKVKGILLELLQTPEVQRLALIRQTGLAYLVFPGANHTRIEHSLGTAHVAGRVGRELQLEPEEGNLLQAAAMLHDLGHYPFSHTLEYLVSDRTDSDHMRLTSDLVTGKIERDEEFHTPQICEILEGSGLDPEKVARLIEGSPSSDQTTIDNLPIHNGQSHFGSPSYIENLMHGTVDVDQMDFLPRDSHYTGVALGSLDLDRLINTFQLHNHELVIHRRGLPALEGMLVARGLMYSSVYFHKTVRIAELMLARAVELLDDVEDIIRMTDPELLCYLSHKTPDVVKRIKYRNLFKRAFTVPRGDKDQIDVDELKRLGDHRVRSRLEDELCDRARIPRTELLVDIPAPEIDLSEPRLGRTDIKIMDRSPKPLSRMSSLARALKTRPVPDWALMVACSEKHRERVEKVSRKHFEGWMKNE